MPLFSFSRSDIGLADLCIKQKKKIIILQHIKQHLLPTYIGEMVT